MRVPRFGGLLNPITAGYNTGTAVALFLVDHTLLSRGNYGLSLSRSLIRYRVNPGSRPEASQSQQEENEAVNDWTAPSCVDGSFTGL